MHRRILIVAFTLSFLACGEPTSLRDEVRGLIPGPHESLRLWHVESGRTLSTLPRPGAGLAAFASLPDWESLAVALEQRLLLWDAPSGAVSALALERFPHDQLYSVDSLISSPDGRTLATSLLYSGRSVA